MMKSNRPEAQRPPHLPEPPGRERVQERQARAAAYRGLRRKKVVLDMVELRKADKKKHPGAPRPDEVIIEDTMLIICQPQLAHLHETNDGFIVTAKNGTIFRNASLTALLRDVLTVDNAEVVIV